MRTSWQFCQRLLVQLLCLVIVGGQGDYLVLFVLWLGDIMAVQFADVILCNSVIAQIIEQPDEAIVLLTEYLVQFDKHKATLLQCFGLEEMWTPIITAHDGLLVVFHYGWKLIEIPYHQYLHTTETLLKIVAHRPHPIIYRIQHIGSEHAHLIYDDKVDVAQHLPSYLVQRMLSSKGALSVVISTMN